MFAFPDQIANGLAIWRATAADLTNRTAALTSDEGFATRTQAHGVVSAPFNPLALAFVKGCSMVARTFAGDPAHLKSTILAALRHKDGFALVDILQPCVSFNKVNTYKWYKERVRPTPPEHDPYDRMKALALAFQWATPSRSGSSTAAAVPVLKRGSQRFVQARWSAV